MNEQGLLDGLDDVLDSSENGLGKIHDSVTGEILGVMGELVDQVAQLFRMSIERAWQMLVSVFQQMGLEEAWVWIVARTPFVGGKATEIESTLKQWNYDAPELNVDVTEIRQSIARVVSSEFEGASSTANAMRRSISEFRKSENPTRANLPLAVS